MPPQKMADVISKEIPAQGLQMLICSEVFCIQSLVMCIMCVLVQVIR